MRAISLMYELSGGCNHGHTCGECKYYDTVKHKRPGDSKYIDYGVCFRHPLREPVWKSNFMACKWWKSVYQKVVVGKPDQCEGQMSIDMFL